MIKNIIFDIGNVLTVFGWEDYFSSFGFLLASFANWDTSSLDKGMNYHPSHNLVVNTAFSLTGTPGWHLIVWLITLALIPLRPGRA